MTRDLLIPCIWLDDEAEEAATFYAETFPESRVVGTSRYPESGDNPSGKPPGSVLTVELAIAGRRFTLLNGGPMFQRSPNLSFFVYVDAAQADALYGALMRGGQALMPLDAYPWSERYAWVEDRFGVSWQLIAGTPEPSPPDGGLAITPCLMFAGTVRGRSEEALRSYAARFEGAELEALERYGDGAGQERWLKHGRLRLPNGQALVAMDSHVDHDATFTEALSLQVMCADQAEVDRFWDGFLADGGQAGPCGWLKDRFGFSWQITPRVVADLFASDDAAARDRAFGAMLAMGKLDEAALLAAFEG